MAGRIIDMQRVGLWLRHMSGWSSDELTIEQFHSLRPQVPIMYLAVFINVLFLANVTARSAGNIAFAVPLVMAALTILRIAIWQRTKRHPLGPSILEMRRSMVGTIMVAGVVSIALSVWTQSILGHGSAPEQAYIALFTALCTISCAACLASLPLAAYIVVGVGTLPISIGLLMTGNFLFQHMGANLLLISPLVIGMIYRQHRQLCHMVESRRDITAEQVKFSDLAYHDPLTGLANRRAFFDELKAASAGTGKSTLAVGIIDLDGFKVINDTYGHQAGDVLLVETARRCQRVDMGDALIARFGGDEFAVLLRDVASVESAQIRLAALAKAFDQPFLVGPHAFRIAASIGLAHNITDAGTSLDLVNRADLAMYVSKRSPDATISNFEPVMEAQTRRRVMIQQALATHADNELIELRYQPVVETATDSIVAFEALARWTHPILGVISPAEFIPLAEQAGMTGPMTAHLLSMALRTAASWPDGIGLSFNLSAAELTSPGLAERLLAIVAQHDFDSSLLSIEVTETALLSDFAAARKALGKLQEGGVRILLDDFGAGYASIGYLREIHFDGIKLDGSLIASLIESPASHDLLTGVLLLCEAIGAPVTAEMVESEAQHDLLRSLGVQKVQGYFLSRPLTAKQSLAACIAGRAGKLPVKSSIVSFGQRHRQRRHGGQA